MIRIYHLNIISKSKIMKIVVALLIAVTLASQCQKGGLLDQNNQCFYPHYQEGCLSYAPNNQCNKCQYNYQLSQGRCYYSPKNSQDCCLQFDSNSRCTKCAEGLQSHPQSGICLDSKLVGCLVKQPSGQSCKICAHKYDLLNGRCISSISGCIKYDQSQNCILCHNSTTLQHGTCIPKLQTTPIDNCKIQNQYGCGVCNNGFRIGNQGECQPERKGCLLYQPNGNCRACQAPYYALNNGVCVIVGCLTQKQGACQNCDASAGFKLSNGQCIIDNCIYFTSKGCVTCANGLVAGSWGCRQPTGKVCLICKIDQYLGSDGKCYPKDIHCISYKGGICQKCCDQFFLSASNECKQIMPGCIYKNGICSGCQAPFSFNNGNCYIYGCTKYNREGCVSCDSRLVLFGNVCGIPHCRVVSEFRCKECLAGYAVDQKGQCAQVDPNCLQRNNLNICLKCKDGFRLDQSGLCTTNKFGCNYIDGRCTSCRAPFVYDASTESCQIDGCLQYFIGGCKRCGDNGYSLIYNSCKLPNCLISKNGKCLECDPDFIFRSDGQCVSKDEFCQKMDQYGTCIKCMDTYYYSHSLQKCVKKSPGCIYNQQDQCSSCQSPFTYDSGRCVVKGCLRLDYNGCRQCKYPFSLTQKHTCQIAHCTNYGQDGRCSACAAGYALSSNSLCELEDQHCDKYNTQRSACIKCRKGYFVDRQGRCEYGDRHCSDFDETGLCINCDRLYFLNYNGKCQLRDPQCLVYTNGLCSSCRPYFFPKAGVCMANLKGCRVQKAYDNCVECDDGYELKNGHCKAKITKLSWNSIDMDFFGDDDTFTKEESKSVFTVGTTSKLNLLPALSQSTCKAFYSSSSLNGASFVLSSSGNNGWSPSGQSRNQYFGVVVPTLQTFYAIDIQQLTGSSLKSFSIQYSMDGKNFISVQDFSFESVVVGSIVTFYFKPVYAKAIRLVVTDGTPNIRVEFYYSSASTLGKDDQKEEDTFIGKTVAATIDGVEEGGISQCNSTGLCWAGVQSCEPKKIQGFSLVYSNGCQDKVSEVKIEYSTDGLTFQCYKECKAISLSGDGLVFPEPLVAQKMHIHFTKYSGSPSFGVKFDFL